jgi:hypothetical protein
MGNAVQPVQHTYIANGKNARLQKIPKLLQKMNDDPQTFDQTLEIMKIIDPEFVFLINLDDAYTEYKIKFINMLPQEDFGYILEYRRKNLSKQILTSLSSKKLLLWYNNRNKGTEIFLNECTLISIFISKNMIPEHVRLNILNGYLQGNCGDKKGTTDHYETLELMLMTYGDTLEIDIKLPTDIKVLQIVAKYLQNKNKMLQLECETKDAHIRESENKTLQPESETTDVDIK